MRHIGPRHSTLSVLKLAPKAQTIARCEAIRQCVGKRGTLRDVDDPDAGRRTTRRQDHRFSSTGKYPNVNVQMSKCPMWSRGWWLERRRSRILALRSDLTCSRQGAAPSGLLSTRKNATASQNSAEPQAICLRWRFCGQLSCANGGTASDRRPPLQPILREEASLLVLLKPSTRSVALPAWSARDWASRASSEIAGT